MHREAEFVQGGYSLLLGYGQHPVLVKAGGLDSRSDKHMLLRFRLYHMWRPLEEKMGQQSADPGLHAAPCACCPEGQAVIGIPKQPAACRQPVTPRAYSWQHLPWMQIRLMQACEELSCRRVWQL